MKNFNPQFVWTLLVSLVAAGSAWGVSNYQISELRQSKASLESRLRRMEFLLVKVAQKNGIDTSRIEE